jgi:hypothetical protein
VILAPILLAAALSQAEPAPEPTTPTPAPAVPASPTSAPSLAALGATAPRLSGFVQAAWTSVDAPGNARDANTFELRLARLQVTGNALARVAYRVVADVAERDASRIVKDAYVSLRLFPGADLKLGQFKTPFGYEQPELDTRLLWLNASYLVPGLSRGPDSRDLGVGFSGAWSVAGPASVEVSTAIVNGAGPNKADDLVEKNVWTRVGGTLALFGWKARAGVSHGYGRQLQTLGADATLGTADDVSFYFHRLGGDVQLDAPWFFAAAEVAFGRHDFSNLGGVTRARGQSLGVYGKTPWGVGPVFRYDGYDPSDRVAGNARERITLGAYYDLLPVAARLVFNYEIDQSAPAVKTGNAATLLAQVLF